MRRLLPLLLAILPLYVQSQLAIARDTISVTENGRCLKMPWANGLNFVNVSETDFDGDGRKDLLIYDKLNNYGSGAYRCFLNTGNAGELRYRSDGSLPYFFPKTLNWAVMRAGNSSVAGCSGTEYLFTSGSSGITVYRNNTANGVPSFQLVKNVLLSDYNPNGNPYIVNIYASPVSVPGIADVDGDGDLDILSYSSQGTSIEFHKNMSIELYQHCDSFIYELGVYCWGNMDENGCKVSFNSCSEHQVGSSTQRELHAGSCLSCIDSDGDLDQDLVMGDISCDFVHYVHNTGSNTSAKFTDTTRLYPNFPNKGSTRTVRLNSFPCAYFADADGDGRKDMIVAPNTFGAENAKGVWLYRNTSTTQTVSFDFVKENFLQDEMIETGQNSYPLLIDVDADGKKDLLIGNHGYYVYGPSSGSISARLTLYKNTGTATAPAFSLVTRDYAGLSSKSLGYAMPAAGDIDGDKDIDLLLGSFSGQVHWLVNTGGAGQACNFSTLVINPFTFTTQSGVAAPQLFDLDEDGLLDLLIGMKNGRIAYYRNTGTATTPAFSLVTSALGGVDTKSDPSVFLLDGFATPHFYRENGLQLLAGSVDGSIRHYSVSSVTSPFTLLSSKANQLREGAQATVWYEDINGDGKRDLFTGNAAGGLSFFSSASPYVGIAEKGAMNAGLKIYPNPANDKVAIRSTGGRCEISVMDLFGKLVFRTVKDSEEMLVDISGFPAGIYIILVRDQNGAEAARLLKY